VRPCNIIYIKDVSTTEDLRLSQVEVTETEDGLPVDTANLLLTLTLALALCQ
jgi:hypothetical protein